MALLKDYLIAHYKMNDNLATDVIIDETGNHNGAVKDTTGTATSAFHSVAGKINLAQDLDGTDDHIEIADHADFTPALTPFSISAWVYMHGYQNFRIADKYDTGQKEWSFGTLGAGKIYWNMFDEDAVAYIGRYFDTALFTCQNQWIHLVATYDGGILSSGIKIFLNGVRVDDSTDTSGAFVAIENLTANVEIGRRDTTYANGLIDNVMFFNKELTPLEVKLLYNGGAGTENIPFGIQLSRTGQHFSSFPEN